jgi:hypothetical protein
MATTRSSKAGGGGSGGTTARPSQSSRPVAALRLRLTKWFLLEVQVPTMTGVYSVHLLSDLADAQATYSELRYYRKYDAETGYWSQSFVTAEAAEHASCESHIAPPIVWCGLAVDPTGHKLLQLP